MPQNTGHNGNANAIYRASYFTVLPQQYTGRRGARSCAPAIYSHHQPKTEPQQKHTDVRAQDLAPLQYIRANNKKTEPQQKHTDVRAQDLAPLQYIRTTNQKTNRI
jgi:hypothetical protein